jgi:hypothetical protein
LFDISEQAIFADAKDFLWSGEDASPRAIMGINPDAEYDR